MTFIHIPKTAGTSIELALGLDLRPAIENVEACFGKITSPELKSAGLSSAFLQHLRLDELEQMHPDFIRDSWTFTVVRDPWTRFLSSFRRKDRAMADFARWYCGINLHTLNLEQYLELGASYDLLHLRSQSSFLEGSATVNVFYFEHLSQLLQALSQRLGRALHLPKVKGPITPLKKPFPLQERKLRKRLKEIYAEDYMRFYPDQQPPAPDPRVFGLIRTLRSNLALRLGSQ